MGNSLIFPVPKCAYTPTSLQPFYHAIPVVEEYYSSKLTSPKTLKQSIPTLHIKSSVKSKYLIIYFHGNSCDIGRMFPSLLEYYEHFQIDILAPEYPGYGIYPGRPGAPKMLRDAQHIVDYVTRADGLNYPIENVILIGMSLGSGVAMQLAARYPLLKALVAIAPFTSIRDVGNHVAGSISKLLVPDIFRNYDIMPEMQVPTLFIHGVKDEFIPYSHSVKLYERCGSSKKRLELRELMEHGRYQMERDIFVPIGKFFTETLEMTDLPSFQLKTLDFDQGPQGEKVSKLRAYTTSQFGALGSEKLRILPGRESMPAESYKITAFKSEDWKDDLQITLHESLTVKRVESDTPPISKALFAEFP